MEKIIWTKDVLREFAKIESRHYQWGVSWREGWNGAHEHLFRSMAAQQSPFFLFKIFLDSLGRRRKSPQ